MSENKCETGTHDYEFSSKCKCSGGEKVWHSPIAWILRANIYCKKLTDRRRCKRCKFVWRWGVDWNKRTEQWLGDYGTNCNNNRGKEK